MPSPSKFISVLHTANWLTNTSYFYVESQFNVFYLTSLLLSLTAIQGVGRAVKVYAFYRSKLALAIVPGYRTLLTEGYSVPTDCITLALWVFTNVWLSMVAGKRYIIELIFRCYDSHVHGGKD